MVRLLAALALPALVIIGTGFGTRAFTPEPSQSQWVVWDGKGFSDPDEFARWLRNHGGRYATWARNHPRAAARLEGRELPVDTTAKQQSAARTAKRQSTTGNATVPARQVAEVAAPTTPEAAGARVGHGVILGVLLALALSLVAVAMVPVPVLQAARVSALDLNVRLVLASAGASIAIGVALARALAGD